MKKPSMHRLAGMLILICLLIPINGFSAAAKNESITTKESNVKIYQDVSLVFLNPYIQNAVDDYYKEYFRNSPTVVPYMNDVLKASRPRGEGSYIFLIEVEVLPYFGPHLTVGVDKLTLRVRPGYNDVQVLKFEHIKSNPLPPNYQGEILNKWPPDLN